MKTALVFPGQGSQSVGMGKDLADNFAVAKAVFDEVDAALSEKLTMIMWDGPEEALTLTRNTQPALMAHSIAALRVLESETGLDVSSVAAVAGHSLGEYSALCAAGTFSVADTAKLLRIRGDAMQAAVPAGDGKMAAILGLSIEQVEAVLSTIDGDAQIANDNCPGQVVISGGSGAIEEAMAALKEAGAKRALPLSVSAPFHSQLMAPAADKMAEALASTEMSAPVVPLYANVSAAPTQDAVAIKEMLVQQVTGRVRWTETVATMSSDGVEKFIEIGTGKVLNGLIKKAAKGVETANFGAVSDLERFNS